jgi:ribonuclease HI
VEKVTIYTDGACRGNPGPGGWGAVLISGQYRKEIFGGEPATTNNRMELTAVIRALEALKYQVTVDLYSDSSYVVRGMTEWLPAWQRSGWKTKDGSMRKNYDLWQRLVDINRKHKVRWHWVRGHNLDTLNERADYLATHAIP